MIAKFTISYLFFYLSSSLSLFLSLSISQTLKLSNLVTGLQSTYERAAELLVINIKWLKSLSYFNSLEHFEQLHLLKSSWKDLFLLTAVQDEFPINLNELLSSLGLNNLYDKSSNQLNGHNSNHQVNQLASQHNPQSQNQTSIKKEQEDNKCSSPPNKKFMNSYSQESGLKAIEKKQEEQQNQTNLNDKKDQKPNNGIKSIISILMSNDNEVKQTKKPELILKSNDNLTSNIDSMMHLLVEIRNFHQLIETTKELTIDFNEFTCLKLIGLFKVTKGIDSTKITILQEHSQLMLNNYIAMKLSLNNDLNAQTIRISQLMFVLSLLNSISESTIEFLFFRKTIGKLSVINLINDLYNSNRLESFV